MIRWRIKERDRWEDERGHEMLTVAVFDSRNPDPFGTPDAEVWFSPHHGGAMCTACETPSGASHSQSCKHVRAVKRWANT